MSFYYVLRYILDFAIKDKYEYRFVIKCLSLGGGLIQGLLAAHEYNLMPHLIQHLNVESVDFNVV